MTDRKCDVMYFDSSSRSFSFDSRKEIERSIVDHESTKEKDFTVTNWFIDLR